MAQVRGWRGRGWTEWRDAGEAVFDAPVSRVQARVVLTTSGSASEATVTGLTLAADRVATTAVQPAAALKYRVYATRIGLVGGITANGHTVRTRDTLRGAAHPARPVPAQHRRLHGQGLHDERQPLRVRPGVGRRPVEHPRRLVEPGVGPGELEGPAARAAGGAGGVPERLQRRARPVRPYRPQPGRAGPGRRHVLGRAALTDNAWVDVTLLWTGGGARAVVGSGPLNLRAGRATAYASRGLAATYAHVPVQCYVTGQKITGTYRTTTRWYRLVGGNYVSHAYLSSIYGGTVPRC
ncbi:hypothetical protein V2I01_23610 [Micromonospora sp. BRA006-A]|nr:hypothetical protein [Micromonospora sp. BRA006-A]